MNRGFDRVFDNGDLNRALNRGFERGFDYGALNRALNRGFERGFDYGALIMTSDRGFERIGVYGDWCWDIKKGYYIGFGNGGCSRTIKNRTLRAFVSESKLLAVALDLRYNDIFMACIAFFYS